MEIFLSLLNFTIGNTALTFPLRILLKLSNRFIQERHNNSKTYIAVKVSPGMQKVEVDLGNRKSCLAFFGREMGRSSGINLDKDFRLTMRGKRSDKPEIAGLDKLPHNIHRPD